MKPQSNSKSGSSTTNKGLASHPISNPDRDTQATRDGAVAGNQLGTFAPGRTLARPGLLPSAALALLALGQMSAPAQAQQSTSFDEFHHLRYLVATAPDSHEGQHIGQVFALARVGVDCFGVDAKQLAQVVGDNVLATLSATQTQGQAAGAVANATAEGQYHFTSPTTYWIETTAKGDAAAKRDRCNSQETRGSMAQARSKSQFRVRMHYGSTTITGPLIGSFGFAAAWVNKQNLGGTDTISRATRLRDPVVVSMYDDATNALLGTWEAMRIDSKVRGNGETKMYRDGPGSTGTQWIENAARDMELYIEVGSAFAPDPLEHGIVDVVVEHGIVTRRSLTGRFSGLAIPQLGAPGENWLAAIDLDDIDYSMPNPGNIPTHVDVEMSGAVEGVPDGDAIGQWCDLASDFSDGFGGADISTVPAGESAIGFSCLHGSNNLIEVKSTTFDTELSHLVLPYIVPGAAVLPAPVPGAPGLPATPAAIYVRISDGDPAIGGTVLYGGFGAPQSFTVEGTDLYRVTSANKLDNTAYIGRAIVDLAGAPVIPANTALWIEVSMIPPLGFSDVLIPPSPYADSAYDSAIGRNVLTGAAAPLLEPTSGRRVCLPFQLSGVESVGSTYCTAKVTSNGCTPAIGWSGTPSASSGSGFTVTATNMINNKSCILFYGVNGRAANPFQGGTLCVKAPVRRTPGTMTGGNPPPNDCSGSPSLDMNLFAVGGLGGNPLPALLIPGTVVDCQWWGRDPGFPAPSNTQLSDALEYTIGN